VLIGRASSSIQMRNSELTRGNENAGQRQSLCRHRCGERNRRGGRLRRGWRPRVVVADLRNSRERLANVAGDIDGLAVTADVGEEADVKALIAASEAKYGPVDTFFSNAGLSRKGQESASDADWDVSASARIQPVLRCSSPSRASRNKPAFVATRSCFA
jgi:hypothetical protein